MVTSQFTAAQVEAMLSNCLTLIEPLTQQDSHTIAMAKNVLYLAGTCKNILLSLVEGEDSETAISMYSVIFTAHEDGCTLTLPSGIKVNTGFTAIQAGYTYKVMIVEGLADIVTYN